jgi:hypothetical protein
MAEYSARFAGLGHRATVHDARTGRPTYDETKKPVMGKKIPFCPSLWEGKGWVPAAYSPKTGYLYLPANENLCGSLVGTEQKYEAGKLWLGSEIKDIGLDVTQGSGHIGEIQAWDMSTGEKRGGAVRYPGGTFQGWRMSAARRRSGHQ